MKRFALLLGTTAMMVLGLLVHHAFGWAKSADEDNAPRLAEYHYRQAVSSSWSRFMRQP
jgi:hypothetical protein